VQLNKQTTSKAHQIAHWKMKIANWRLEFD